VHEPDDNAHVTSDEPAFEAFTVPDAPTSNAETSTETVGVSSDVTSSDDDTPESLPDSKSGTPIPTGSAESTVMVAESEFDAGPVVPLPLTEFALSRIFTVPSDVQDTDTDIEDPEAALGVIAQSEAVVSALTTSKSLAMIPETLSEKLSP